MLQTNEFDLKIDAYFDNEMSGEEEAAFMHELDGNPALRERFEEELTIRSILGADNQDEKKTLGGSVFFIPPQTTESAGHNKYRTPVIPFYKRVGSIAAVVILIIAGVAVFIIYKNNSKTAPIAAGIEGKKDTALKIDSSNNLHAPLPNNTEIASNAFGKFYKPYKSDNDPVEVSEYLQDYKQRRYADVLKATQADVQVMGVNDNKDALNQYLQLYKGLAYLAQNRPTEALAKFDSVLNAAHKDAPQYYQAQWYSCLAFLKQGNTSKAGKIAGIIVQSKSPHKMTAGELLRELDVK